MISRVRRLDDLLILRPFSFSRIKCRMSQDSRKEQDRLQFHNLTTIIKYGNSVEQLAATQELDNLKRRYPDVELNSLLGIDAAVPLDNSTDVHKTKRRKINS
jgi:hypothetical protein